MDFDKFKEDFRKKQDNDQKKKEELRRSSQLDFCFDGYNLLVKGIFNSGFTLSQMREAFAKVGRL